MQSKNFSQNPNLPQEQFAPRLRRPHPRLFRERPSSMTPIVLGAILRLRMPLPQAAEARRITKPILVHGSWVEHLAKVLRLVYAYVATV